MTRIRRLALTAGLAVPVAGSTIFVLAAPAMAKAGIASPTNGAVVSGSSLTVRAHADRDAQLLVDGRMVKAGKGDLTHTIDTHAVRNGSHTVELKQRGILLGALGYWHVDSAKFTVRAAPYAPRGVQASMSGRKVTVRWARGSEPDLTSYEVASTAGRAKTSGAVASMCGKSTCGASFAVPKSATGPAAYSVRARRSTGAGGTVSSGASSAALGGAGMVPMAGSAGSAFPTLQPLPNNSPFSLPTVGPTGQMPGFQYPEPQPEVAPARQPAAQNVAAVSAAQWGKSVAIAMILLLAAAHLGMWTRRLRAAQAGAGRGRAAWPALTAKRDAAPPMRTPHPATETPSPAKAFDEWTALATVALSPDNLDIAQTRLAAAPEPLVEESRWSWRNRRGSLGYRGTRRRPGD